jgi:hypothetical protein
LSPIQSIQTEAKILSDSDRSPTVENVKRRGAPFVLFAKCNLDHNFKRRYNVVSFAVANPSECRFIRMIQTGKNHRDQDHLIVWHVEFFGTASW